MDKKHIRVETSGKGAIMSIHIDAIRFVSVSPTIGRLMMDLENGASIEVRKTAELLEAFGLKSDDPSPIIKSDLVRLPKLGN